MTYVESYELAPQLSDADSFGYSFVLNGRRGEKLEVDCGNGFDTLKKHYEWFARSEEFTECFSQLVRRKNKQDDTHNELQHKLFARMRVVLDADPEMNRINKEMDEHGKALSKDFFDLLRKCLSVAEKTSGRYSKYFGEKVSRYKMVKMATPVWVVRREVEAVHDEARTLSYSSGMSYVVDHIVPIKGFVVDGKNKYPVCGLNVPWNLQVITANANAIKHNMVMLNELPPDVPELFAGQAVAA